MSVLWSIVSVLGAIVLGLILFCIAISIVFSMVLIGIAACFAIKESREDKKNGW